MNWIAAGAVFMALGVLLGAFGAHGLKDRLTEYSLSVYEKAVFYHFIHAIGLLLVGLMSKTSAIHPVSANRVGWLLVCGIVLFSGSLYALSLSGVRVLGAVTPFGGIAFICAWSLLVYESLRA